MGKVIGTETTVDLSATEQLIREVTEGVIARGMSARKRRRQEAKAPSTGSGQAPVPSAPSIPAPEAPAPPPPVLVQPPVIIKDTQAPASVISEPIAATGKAILAIFCYEDAAGPIAQEAARIAELLATRGTAVHIFTPKALSVSGTNIRQHELGEPADADLVARAQELSRRAHAAFVKQFPMPNPDLRILAHEWATLPGALEIAQSRSIPVIASLHSLELQRADMTSELSRRIQEIEVSGLRQARNILIHDNRTRDAAAKLVPESAKKLEHAALPFPAQDFTGVADAGAIKARIHVGPIDPMILFIGDLDERHGPDVLVKSVAAVLKNHKQARFVFVGDGALQWPLRVHARYLLLEHAIRILGHVGGQQLAELIQAADVICVPSRENTELWPILAGWAARKPIVASHDVAGKLIEHEKDGVLIYPNESSCVWGVERCLFDENLRRSAGEAGFKKLEEKFGWSSVAVQLEQMMGVAKG